MSLTTAGLAAPSSVATASVTIGQTASTPPNGPPVACNVDQDLLQPTVTSGNAYVVPATVAAGTITSWSTYAGGGGGMLAMKVYRPLGGATYMVVGHDGPRALTAGALNTFQANLAVRAGDVLGNSVPTAAGNPGCFFAVAGGESLLRRLGNLADGGTGDFAAVPASRLNISAVVNPSNAFKLGKVKGNRRKGTATLAIGIPNAGRLALTGPGVKSVARTVTAPGNVKLKIRAKGKRKRTLNETGEVKLKPKITFTPAGGDPNARPLKLKLRRR